MNHLHLISLNVSGLQNDKKRRAVFNWLKTSNYDIIFLQETHCHLISEERRWSLEWDGQCIWSRGTNKSRGVTVLFSGNHIFDFKNVICDIDGRYVVFDLHVSDNKYRLMNIYAPNNGSERKLFFKFLEKFIVSEFENLIAGDFNCALNTVCDRLNCTGSLDIGQPELLNIMNNWDLEDVWRRRNPDKKEYSWCRGQRLSRIDFWLISRSLDNQVDKIGYKVSAFSDHRYTEIKFRISETKHGKGIWKMNTEVIKSNIFHESFTTWWKYWKTKKNEYSNIGTWWDIGKKKVKELCINASQILSHDRKNHIKFLEKNIHDLENNEFKSEAMELELRSCRLELRNILEKKGEGARIRSRVNWFEEGERSSQFFHGLEKRNSKEKSWDKILDDKGEMKYGTNDVIKTQIEFYSDLYSSRKVNEVEAGKFLSKLDSHLGEQDSNNLDGDILMSEMTSALKKIKNNKSPGLDGIPVEFYKMYWKNISEDLHQVLKHSYEIEELPKSQYDAVIRLLYKKGEREDIKNWRPISLLNTDAKIFCPRY